MPHTELVELKNIVADAVRPLTGSVEDYDVLLESIGDARFVLLGEATHRTHEFYRERAQITKRLIREKGFRGVAVEADWPDAWRVDRYVRGDASDADARSWRTPSLCSRSPAERKRVRPALPESYEALFHEIRFPRFLLNLQEPSEAAEMLASPRLERAIGVIYQPESERPSHYFHARLPEQFDVLLHFDHTRAVEPLERTSQWEKAEPPETYPSGI